MNPPVAQRLQDKLLRASGPRLLALPRAVLERLSGGRTTSPRGYSLDPQVKVLIELERLLGFEKLHNLPIAQARTENARAMALIDRPSPPVHRVDEVLVPSGGTHVTMRVYVPKPSEEPLPAIFYLHGGGFCLGSIDTHDAFCRELGLAAQCVVTSVEYRLSPEHRYPEPIDDCIAAYRYLREHARVFGIDPARIAVGGDSAGGYLSAILCQRAVREGFEPPCFQLLLYPALNAIDRTASRNELAEGFFLTDELIEWFLAQYFASETDRWHDDAWPGRTKDLAGQPPAHVVTAGFDPLLDEGEDYTRRLQAAGVPTTYQFEAGLTHGFIQMAGVVDAARLANDRIARRLREALHK